MNKLLVTITSLFILGSAMPSWSNSVAFNFNGGRNDHKVFGEHHINSVVATTWMSEKDSIKRLFPEHSDSLLNLSKLS